MNSSTRDSLWFHLCFAMLAAALLYFARGEALGRGILVLTLGYNVLLPLLAFVRRHPEWMALWSFLLPLSAAQVLPDLALAKIAKVLVFPDLGLYRIGGEVPVYFLGLWTLLLFPILLHGNAARSRYLHTAMLGLLLFVAAEWAAPMLELWHPREVRVNHGVALYVIIPEVALCLAALGIYRLTGQQGILARLAGALCVPVFYAGALFISLALTG